MDYLFVYGTLLKDFKHKARQPVEHLLQLISKATITGALYNLGNYPGYVDTEPGRVKGELYSIANTQEVFDVLDDYEGLHNEQPEYKRIKKAVQLPNGEMLESWVYVFQHQLSREHKRIIDGDYIAYVNKG